MSALCQHLSVVLTTNQKAEKMKFEDGGETSKMLILNFLKARMAKSGRSIVDPKVANCFRMARLRGACEIEL